MDWPSIREFLGIPGNLVGRGVNIAVIDFCFPHHPDISTDHDRRSYLVSTEPDAKPTAMVAQDDPWTAGVHGLWTAAAAAGSGALSNGRYRGAAPRANLYLLQAGSGDFEMETVKALTWLQRNWRSYRIRGVALTVRPKRDTGLLPWQIDPVRVLCEELYHDGLLVVSANGNSKELTCNGSSSPSTISVGGVVVPQNGD